MLHDDTTTGQTFELYGPKNYSTAEIAELVDREIIKRRRHLNLPKAVLKPLANTLNKYLWWPIMSGDEVEREFIDQKIDESAKTFKDLGIEPAELSNLTFHYLVSLSREVSLVLDCVSNYVAARLPELLLLRPASGHRAGEAGGEEVRACSRRSVIVFVFINVYISLLDSIDFLVCVSLISL